MKNLSFGAKKSEAQQSQFAIFDSVIENLFLIKSFQKNISKLSEQLYSLAPSLVNILNEQKH